MAVQIWELSTMVARQLGFIFDTHADDDEEDNPASMGALLRVLLLRDDPPPELVALLSPENVLMAVQCREGGYRRSSRRISCAGRPSWMRTALRYCLRSGPSCTAAWSSPPLRSSEPRPVISTCCLCTLLASLLVDGDSGHLEQ
jgi:hypothetical protein